MISWIRFGLFLLILVCVVYLILVYPVRILDKLFVNVKNVSLPEKFYFLIVGQDRNIQGTVRSDVIIIGYVNLKDKKFVLSNIPRDLVVGDHKINYYFSEGGVEPLKKKIGELLGISVKYHLILDYKSFEILGDLLGPVEIVVKEPMFYYDAVQDLKISFSPGIYKLYGKELLAYIRYRKGGLGDLERIKRQREIIQMLLEKALSKDLMELVRIYSEVSPYIETDFSIYEILHLALIFRKSFKLNFVNFPVYLSEDGNIYVERKKIGEFLKNLESGMYEEVLNLKILLVNAKREKTRMFQPVEEARWKKIAGFTPVQYIWEDFGQIYKGSVVFVTTKSSEKKKKIEELLKKLYPHRKFKVLWTGYLQGGKEYFQYVELFSSHRKYLKYPIDALVILGEL